MLTNGTIIALTAINNGQNSARSRRLIRALRKYGLEVDPCTSATDVADAIATQKDVVALLVATDIPSINLYRVCHTVRLVSSIPIVFISEDHDRVNISYAVEIGADDWLHQMMSANEIAARLHARIRRFAQQQMADNAIQLNGLTIFPEHLEVQIQEKLVQLAPQEMALLLCLANSPNEAISIPAIINELWHVKTSDSERNRLYRLLNRLRSKIEEDTEHPSWIVTDGRKGYMLVADLATQPNSSIAHGLGRGHMLDLGQHKGSLRTFYSK